MEMGLFAKIILFAKINKSIDISVLLPHLTIS